MEVTHLHVPRKHGEFQPKNQVTREPDVPYRCIDSGDHPRLEGGGKTARYMRFLDVADVESARDDLEAIVNAWCNSR